jgi:hypothetical protein
MKNKISMLLLIASTVMFSTVLNAQYVDISTGKTVTLVKHEGTGMMMNTQTQRPVYIYIDPATNDTFYGRTGMNINGKVVRTKEGKYFYDDTEGYIFRDGEYRMRTEADSMGYKRKMQSDGDFKVKHDNYKRKEHQNGDVKVKDPEGKLKMNADGTMKVKDSAYRKKIDHHGNMREKDDSTKVKLNADGSIKVKDKGANYKGKIDENGKMKEKDGKTKTKVKDDKVKEKEKSND